MNSLSAITAVIHDYWSSAAGNSLRMDTGEKAWAEPRVAVAAGDDPFFQRIKELIGPFYWTPQEAYALAFPDNPCGLCQVKIPCESQVPVTLLPHDCGSASV